MLVPTMAFYLATGPDSFVFLIFNLFFILIFLAVPHGMQALTSPTRNRTRAPCSGSVESLTTGPLGNSQFFSFFFKQHFCLYEAWFQFLFPCGFLELNP